MMMKKRNLLTIATTAAVSMAGLTAMNSASAELAANVGLSTIYLWRGQDVSGGSPQFAGDLTFKDASGLYAGAWISSEANQAVLDTTVSPPSLSQDGGQEYDLYAGWAATYAGIGIDASLWNYNYPSDTTYDSFGDLSEFVLGLSYGPASFKWYKNIANTAGSNDYQYFTLGLTLDKFSALVGTTDDSANSAGEYTHLDLTYSYNDRLSFTASTVVDKPDNGSLDGDTLLVIAYKLPISL